MLKKYIINNFNQEISYYSEISLMKSLGNILYKNIIYKDKSKKEHCWEETYTTHQIYTQFN